MDEMNKVPEVESNEEVKVQGNSAPESNPAATTPAPKAHIPKLPLIIGGAIAGIALIAVVVSLIIGGGNHEHSYGAWKMVNEPSCTAVGVEKRVCDCGNEEVRSVDALDHKYVNNVGKAATCTAAGLTNGTKCMKCGKILVSQTTIPATGHTYDDIYDTSCNTCGYMRSATNDSNNINSNSTSLYSGIEVTKLPYTVKGLKITSISFSGNKVTITVTNNTGYAIQEISNIDYKCYNSSGIVLKTGSVFLGNLNNGESIDVTFYAESGTSKILFGDATVYKGNSTSSGSTEIYSGIEVTKLPYTVKGLKITSISFSGNKVTITVTNNTGYAIQEISNIDYKCYNSSGIVLKTGSVFLGNLNNGESIDVTFYAESGTSKILFGDATVYRQ